MNVHKNNMALSKREREKMESLIASDATWTPDALKSTPVTDVLSRAKAQLIKGAQEMAEAGEVTVNPGLVPELVAEIERLRQTSDLQSRVVDFIHWVARNEFSDPENMLVCAEWFNLCGAVGLDMTMAGSEYKKDTR